ncbi:MAG: hypothetical protein K0U60_06595 [Actinomycetia bacterium]|nr:hypothetical protein [Actinomycetes bacterium]MCH9801418.1 hypothetical protein [Actinomycetes bacterium]
MTDQLADLPFDEVKHQAIELAEKRHDVGFFFDLIKHTPAVAATADEGGSLGEFSGTITELVEAARELFGSGDLGELEPLFRARFEDYLRQHGHG